MLQFRGPSGIAEVIDGDNLYRELDPVHLNGAMDIVSWALEASGCFSTSSVYHKICDGWTSIHFKEAWRAMIPMKIKIFL
jgi:hypothetical protein